jgi:hypothetical protein
VKPIDITPYGGKLWVYTSRAKFRARVRKVRGTDISTKGSAGLVVPHGSHYVVGVFDHRLGTLVHEITHVCMFEAVRTNFHIDNANDEALAYLMGYLTTQAASILKVS